MPDLPPVEEVHALRRWALTGVACVARLGGVGSVAWDVKVRPAALSI